jgi:exodeoxyribonuclease VII large subunit
MRPRVWPVGDLIREINSLLDQGFAGIRVEGEVTNATTSARGHLYFTLTDGTAALDCVMFSSRAGRLRFRLEDGLAVVAGGSLTVYPQRGRFQMVVESLEPQGQGALQLAFEQLKARLAAEGLFAAGRKRPLPALPQRVGIVTSVSGAALRDMLKVLRRLAHIEVVVAPSRVQGEGAAAEIAGAVRRLGATGLVDVVVLSRGGGSLEDLWAFNEEVVARAIADCPVPVVSGVGHEVDFTIADLVADVRAATPTQAAELLVARLEEQLRRLELAQTRLARDLSRHLQLARARLAGLEGSAGLARLPARVRQLRQRLDRADRLPTLLRRLVEAARTRLATAERALGRLPSRVAAGGHARVLATRTEQLVHLMQSHLRRAATALGASERSLVHLSPRRVLARGYSITTVEGSDTPVKDADAVRPGAVLLTTLARGRLRSIVHRPDARRRSRPRSAPEQASLFDPPPEQEPRQPESGFDLGPDHGDDGATAHDEPAGE